MKNNRYVPDAVRVVQIVLVSWLGVIVIFIASAMIHHMRAASMDVKPEEQNSRYEIGYAELSSTSNIQKRNTLPEIDESFILEEVAPSLDAAVESNFQEETTFYIEMSEDDIYELATLVYLEAGGESFECQQGVASVVINRMTTGGMTLQEVIYQKNQFTPAYLISSSSPSESTLEAVRTVIKDGPTLPEYVTFFRADYYFSWVTPYTSIDHTYFSYDNRLKEALGY